jgi:hypothetical protein
METGDEPLPTDETALVEQHTDKVASVMNPAAPALRPQRNTRFIEDIRPQPGSNVQRTYRLSNCVIAVAFTLFVVNIHLPPAGLSESQLLNNPQTR